MGHHLRLVSHHLSNRLSGIADSFSMNRMTVNVTGCLPLQKCFLWFSTDKDKANRSPFQVGHSNQKFDHQADVPKKPSEYPNLATGNELEPADGAIEFMEAGLVSGLEPACAKCTVKQRAANNGEAAPLPRCKKAMRVFTPVTEVIKGQNKLYVGCHPKEGRFSARVIDTTLVFFHAELWSGIDSTTIRNRQLLVLGNIRKFAARKTVEIQREVMKVVRDSQEKINLSNPLKVMHQENVCTKVKILVSLFQTTKHESLLTSIQTTLEESSPDLKFGPLTPMKNIELFFKFDDAFDVSHTGDIVDGLRLGFSVLFFNFVIFNIIASHAKSEYPTSTCCGSLLASSCSI